MTTPQQQQPPQEQQPLQQPVAPQPAKKGIKVPRLVISLVVLVVLGGVGWYLSRDDALNAKVGDCLHQKGANDLSIVKCDSADADFSVLGRVENKTESEVDAKDVCDQWADTSATYWEGKPGQKGTVLCLKATK
ncbi:LppU/SCO3897 family protein [Dactylosporangium salmoneum]|uniref:Septum formation-related domain-containing protein n=1 Tax=Dactylosporangium salmoneum TaxID=53361 RepID=A0ABN3GR03_9ACTN